MARKDVGPGDILPPEHFVQLGSDIRKCAGRGRQIRLAVSGTMILDHLRKFCDLREYSVTRMWRSAEPEFKHHRGTPGSCGFHPQLSTHDINHFGGRLRDVRQRMDCARKQKTADQPTQKRYLHSILHGSKYSACSKDRTGFEST